MAYGTVKVDNITFTNGGIDQTVTVSGIVQSISGDITATGTIQGATIIGTSTVSGATVTGNAGVFTTVTGGSAGFTTVTGTTVTGTTANFATISGTTITGSVGNFGSGSAAAPSVSVGTTDNGIYSPGADQLALSTNGTGRLTVDSTGNITHTYSDSSTSTSTQVPPGLRIYNTNNTLGRLAGIHFAHGGSGAATAGIFNVTTSTLAGSTDSLGDLAFYMKANGSGTMTERLRITSAGLVGVGTSTPQLSIGAVGGNVLHLAGAGTTGVRVQNTSGNSVDIYAGTDGFINQSGSGVLNFQLAGSTKATLTSTGLGIGTSAPGSGNRLHIADTSKTSTDRTGIKLQTTDALAANTGLPLVWSGNIGNTSDYTWASITGRKENATSGDAAGYLQFATGSSGGAVEEKVRIDSAGRVGIGTTSPGATLDVAGNQRFSAANPVLEFNNGGPQIFVPGANTLAFATGGGIGSPTERARIDSSGRLLVGTSTSSGYSSARMIVTGAGTDATGSGNLVLQIGQANGSVTSGEQIGTITFGDTSGYSYATIEAAADLTAGSDSPGRLVFSTTADGASSPTERMRISSSGTTTITGGGTGANNNFLAQNSSSARVLALRDDGYTQWGTGTNAPYNFGVSTSTKAMFMDSSGGFGFNTSIRASKTNIEAAPNTDWIHDLDVITFNYRCRNEDGTYSDDAEPELRWGVIAEDAEQVNPDFCSYDSSGKLDGFHYDRMIPVLLKAIQELKAEVVDLKAQLA